MGILLKAKIVKILLTATLCSAVSIFSHGTAVAADDRVIILEQNGLLRVEVHQLYIEQGSQVPVVILSDSLEERGLKIWIGPCEANAINLEMNGIDHFRPLTHDLLEKVLEKADLSIQRVIVTHIQKGIYYATL